MPTETVTQLFPITGSTRPDFIQEIIEQTVISRLGQKKMVEKTFYRRVSDRAELTRISDIVFEIAATGEMIVLVERSLSQNPNNPLTP